MKTTRKEAISRRPKAPRHPQPHVISTSTHGLIRWVAALRQREERERRSQFILEGQRLVALSLRQPVPPELLLYTRPAPQSFLAHLLAKARHRGLKCHEISEPVLRELAHIEDPQGILAVAPSPVEHLSDSNPPTVPEGRLPCWLAIESIQKPGNLGTILRTAEAVGAAGVIAVGREVDFLDPSCVRASMGGLFGLRLLRATWPQLLQWKQEQGICWVASSPAASIAYDLAIYSPPVVIWVGDERKGLSATALEACDLSVRIPMVGRADSLNVAVSAGLLLYEVFRQSARNCVG